VREVGVDFSVFIELGLVGFLGGFSRIFYATSLLLLEWTAYVEIMENLSINLSKLMDKKPL
jgi:hypothetical protein